MGHIAWKIVLTVLLFSLFASVGFTIFVIAGVSYAAIMTIPFFGALLITVVNFATAWIVSEVLVWLALWIKERYM